MYYKVEDTWVKQQSPTNVLLCPLLCNTFLIFLSWVKHQSPTNVLLCNVLQSRGHNKTLAGDWCLTQDKKIKNVLQSRGHNKTLVGDW
jgi:hypothetical protein